MLLGEGGISVNHKTDNLDGKVERRHKARNPWRDHAQEERERCIWRDKVAASSCEGNLLERLFGGRILKRSNSGQGSDLHCKIRSALKPSQKDKGGARRVSHVCAYTLCEQVWTARSYRGGPSQTSTIGHRIRTIERKNNPTFVAPKVLTNPIVKLIK